ncbi:hypothetical protein AB0395_33180 [Streptosporangium sp. NPDC051023]|uniref:hypothetical protein n=1 Tax=Streptosporangium sp. NPDC051023 TaxID=3155410 RepID=UPI00344DEA2C
MSKLRERLQQRALPLDVWWVRIDPLDVVAKAKEVLEEAEDALRVTQVTAEEGAPELAAAMERVERARVAVAACYEPVTVLALDPTEYEALLKEHPPQTKEAAWGPGFGRALLLEGVQGDMDRDEWVVWLDSRLSHGERVEAYNLALSVNVRVLDPGIPKGWTVTRS